MSFATRTEGWCGAWVRVRVGKGSLRGRHCVLCCAPLGAGTFKLRLPYYLAMPCADVANWHTPPWSRYINCEKLKHMFYNLRLQVTA